MTQQSMTLGGEGGNAFPFDNVGDAVTGTVVALEQQQQTDMESGEPAWWDDAKTRPKIMYAVTLQTALRDAADDDGLRTIYLRGSTKPETQSSLAAVRSAVKAATGGYDIAYGGKLTLTFSGQEPSKQRGFSPRKLYTAQYEAPSMALGGEPTPTPAPVASAPAVATPPSPAASATPPAASTPAGITPEQLAAMQAMSAPAPAWDSDPRVAQLRAMGIADDAIRQTLNL